METPRVTQDLHLTHQFKSYYVVWKPAEAYLVPCPIGCLNRTMQYGNKIEESGYVPYCLFKSYYVVWKLKNDQKKDKIPDSLNRTMQYGNYYVIVGRKYIFEV